DTGVFDQNRYFDVFMEYAKSSPEDILIQITVRNRGDESAELHLLPTVWFRNVWSWPDGVEKPSLCRTSASTTGCLVTANDGYLGERYFSCDGQPTLLFTENETNTERIFGVPALSPYTKDSFHRFLVNGDRDAVNPDHTGTKVAAHYRLTVAAGQQQVVRL